LARTVVARDDENDADPVLDEVREVAQELEERNARPEPESKPKAAAKESNQRDEDVLDADAPSPKRDTDDPEPVVVRRSEAQKGKDAQTKAYARMNTVVTPPADERAESAVEPNAKKPPTPGGVPMNAKQANEAKRTKP
jgi:hypothetical protein